MTSDRAQVAAASRSLPGCPESRQDPLGLRSPWPSARWTANQRDLKLHQKTIQYR